ncbi:MAG: ABC transporter permease [Bacillota bacterium]
MAIPAATKQAAPAGGPQGERWLAVLWKRFRRSRTGLFGLGVVLLFIFTALFAPYLVPHDPEAADFAMALKGPSSKYWLGTDELGRDLFSRLLIGARISVLIGVVSVAIGLTIGVPLGLISGYYGGRLDQVISRGIDILLAFPSILLAIFLVAFLGPSLSDMSISSLIPGPLMAAMIAVGIVSVPTYARLVRGSTLAARDEDYVTAARAAGSRDLRILARHILPNVMAPILVQSSLQIASAILSAAALGFLGLGAPPNIPEWGTMLQKARTYVFSAPHLMTFPGVAIALVVLGFNLLGDALRDALDPRLKH